MQYRLSIAGEGVPATLADKVDGVGLLRSEYLLRRRDQHITSRETQDDVQKYLELIASQFFPKPVWYRCVDLWSDEANSLDGNDLELDEPNPLVGCRGLRRSIKTPETFLVELSVLTEVAQSWPNLHVLFPFVGDVQEFQQGLRYLDAVKWTNRIGTMLEIPSAIVGAVGFVQAGASNLLVGLNDLTSLMLGTERGHDDKLHDAVWWCVEHVRDQVGSATEWGLGGNLDAAILARAKEKNVPYATVHYFQAPDLFDVPADDLPDLDWVRSTKVKTRKRIKDYYMRKQANSQKE